MNSTELETRLIEFEIRLSHQDDTLEALNQVIIKQQRDIDGLQGEISQLKQRLQSVSAAGDVIAAEQEPRPPHY